MNPRKKDSKKWTAIPKEFLGQIKAIFEQNFQQQLTNKRLQVDGRIYPSEIILRVGVQEKGEIRFRNFEVSLDHSKEKQDAVNQIHFAVDAVASLFVDYLSDEEASDQLPLVWQETPFEKQTIWLQYTSANSELEAEADKLLGSASLLDEDLDADSDLDLHSGLDLDSDSDSEIEDTETADDDETKPDEAIDTSQPTLFGGAPAAKKKKSPLH